MTTAAVHPDGAPHRARAAGTLSAFALLLGGLGLLHALMWLYDLQHPERFLNTDRALVRIDVIERFAQTWREGGDLAAFAAAHGIVGDWLPHALIYLAGGPPLIIAVQVLLALASVAWVRDIGLRLELTQGQAAGAAALYALLPHTLVFPHQLASEAISVPLVVLSFALLLRSPAAGRQARAGLAMGLATLVRPVTMLWPIVHALAAWRAAPAARLAYLGAGLAPLLLWMGLVFNETQEFSMGRSKHDLAHNLYHRVQRMAAHLPPQERFADRQEARLGVAEYLRFVAAHPGPALAHVGRDMMTLGLKSGVERVAIDYLELYPGSQLQDPQDGWRNTVEQNGMVQGVLRLAQEHPGLVAVSVGGAALFVVFMALALLGAWILLRSGRWMLVAFVLYIFATATAVDAAQSRQRAPAEFALCLLAVTGFCALQRRRLDGR